MTDTPDMVARDHLGTGSRVGNRTLKGFIGQLDDDNRGIDGLGTLWTDPRPEYFSPFLGSIPGPGKKFLDDRNLVNAAGGGRKIVKVQLWCGGDTVYSMIPWYQGKSGASNSRHWQYASNVKAGIYKELILKPDEYITQVIYDVCPTPGGGSKLCFLALRKSTLNGPQTQMVTCGTARHTGQYQSEFSSLLVRDLAAKRCRYVQDSDGHKGRQSCWRSSIASFHRNHGERSTHWIPDCLGHSTLITLINLINLYCRQDDLSFGSFFRAVE